MTWNSGTSPVLLRPPGPWLQCCLLVMKLFLSRVMKNLIWLKMVITLLPDHFGFLPQLVHPFLGFLPLVFFSELNVPSFDLCRKFALCFCVDIDEHDFCSCPSEDPEILTQWMNFEIVFDWCWWSTLHMCLLKLRMGYLLSWLGWFANQVEAHNLWWLR